MAYCSPDFSPELLRSSLEGATALAAPGSWFRLQQLGRIQRWLDNEPAARAAYARAAASVAAVAERRAGFGWNSRAGILWTFAGDAEQGRVWLERAAIARARSTTPRRAQELARVLYLMGEFDQVLTLLDGDRGWLWTLAASRVGQPVKLETAKRRIVQELAQETVFPGREHRVPDAVGVARRVLSPAGGGRADRGAVTRGDARCLRAPTAGDLRP